MFIATDRDEYVRAATHAMLRGEPFETLVDACRRQAAEVAAAKVVSIAAARARLRPATITTDTE
jgi:hypothetical protein